MFIFFIKSDSNDNAYMQHTSSRSRKKGNCIWFKMHTKSRNSMISCHILFASSTRSCHSIIQINRLRVYRVKFVVLCDLAALVRLFFFLFSFFHSTAKHLFSYCRIFSMLLHIKHFPFVENTLTHTMKVEKFTFP